MDYNFGWNNAQNIYGDQERYQDFNPYQQFNAYEDSNAYQVNSFDCYNSYYAPYPPSNNFSCAFENQYHDLNSYMCNDVDTSLTQSNPSLHSSGLFKQVDDLIFEIANKSDIPCDNDIPYDSIAWYEENAKRNNFIWEVRSVWHEGSYKIPPCVNFPLIHDSCLAIDDNVVSDESTYVVNDCPMRANDNLDAIEILPNLENIVELNTLVDELKFDECPIIIEKEIKIDEIENFALEYRDPIWEEYMSRAYNDYSDNFSSYFEFSKSLEHGRFLKVFVPFNESKVYLHNMLIIQIRRYVHLFAFSPH